MQALLDLDYKLFFILHNLQRFNLDLVLAWPTHLGSLSFVIPFLLVLLLIQGKDHYLPRMAMVLSPVLIAYLGTATLKILIARPRPFVFFKDSNEINLLFSEPSSYSFPSGHTTTAFAAAVVLIHFFKVPKPLALGLATLVALTRPYLGVHFPSDILVGALWGSIAAILSIQALSWIKSNDPNTTK